MKTLLKICLTLILLTSFCYAQGYDETITQYHIHFYRVTTGTPNPDIQSFTVFGDTTLMFVWQNGIESTPGYVTQLVGEEIYVMDIDNSPSMWDSGSAVLTRDVVGLDNGLYEITMTCRDLAGNVSDYSEPIYMTIAGKTARVIINFRIM